MAKTPRGRAQDRKLVAGVPAVAIAAVLLGGIAYAVLVGDGPFGG